MKKIIMIALMAAALNASVGSCDMYLQQADRELKYAAESNWTTKMQSAAIVALANMERYKICIQREKEKNGSKTNKN